MLICTERDIHPERTRRSGLIYCFTPKHHGAGTPADGRWLPTLSRPDEFAVFDMADDIQLADDDGHLYGIRIVEEAGRRTMLEIGTKREQIAKFWLEEQADAHWHGFPCWPIGLKEAGGRGKQDAAPPRAVFDRMKELGLISSVQKRKLLTGKRVGKLGEVSDE